MEHDRRRGRCEAVEPGDRKIAGAIDVDVPDLAARAAQDVMMLIGVRIESGGSAADRQRVDLTHVGEIGECRVDGAQRNAWHFSARRGVESLSGWVTLVPVEQTEQQLPLRGHLESSSPEGIDEFWRRLHSAEVSDIDSQSASRADYTDTEFA